VSVQLRTRGWTSDLRGPYSNTFACSGRRSAPTSPWGSDGHVTTSCGLFREAGGALAKEPDRFKTVVIDTVDELYRMCAEHICKRARHQAPRRLPDYGKGWGAISDEFQAAGRQAGRSGTRRVVYQPCQGPRDQEARRFDHDDDATVSGQGREFLLGSATSSSSRLGARRGWRSPHPPHERGPRTSRPARRTPVGTELTDPLPMDPKALREDIARALKPQSSNGAEPATKRGSGRSPRPRRHERRRRRGPSFRLDEAWDETEAPERQRQCARRRIQGHGHPIRLHREEVERRADAEDRAADRRRRIRGLSGLRVAFPHRDRSGSAGPRATSSCSDSSHPAVFIAPGPAR